MINYLIGDVTNPIGQGKKIIVHCCNDVGLWGSGVVLAISKKWKQPEKEFKSLSISENIIGNTQIVLVEDDIFVANIIGQHNIHENEFRVPPIRYEAILVGLKKVVELAKSTDATIHMPRIGCFRAGGRWSIMEKVIESVVENIDVYVYDFNAGEGYYK